MVSWRLSSMLASAAAVGLLLGQNGRSQELLEDQVVITTRSGTTVAIKPKTAQTESRFRSTEVDVLRLALSPDVPVPEEQSLAQAAGPAVLDLVEPNLPGLEASGDGSDTWPSPPLPVIKVNRQTQQPAVEILPPAAIVEDNPPSPPSFDRFGPTGQLGPNPPGHSPDCGPCCQRCTPGWIAYADLVYMKPRIRFADLNPLVPSVRTMTVLERESPSLELDHNVAARLFGGYRFHSCWDVLLGYTYFETDEMESFIEDSIEFTATADLDYGVVDLEVGRWMCLDHSVDVRLFGGFRWGMIDVDFDRVVALAESVQLERYQSDMDAFGIRVGGEFHWNVSHGLSAYLRGSGSVLVGRFEVTNLFRESISSNVSEARITETITQGVPVLDTAAGVQWRCCQFSLSIGYELATWFNAGPLPPPEEVASVDATFDGVFLRAALNY